MRPLGVILCALVALQAGADTLADLRAAVGRLGAKQAVRATLAVDVAMKAAGKFSNQNMARTLSLEVAHDAAGISLTIPQTLLDRRAGGGRGNKAVQAIGSIQPLEVVEAIDYRETLLALIEGATVLSEKRAPHNGRPVRLLVLKLKPRPEKNDDGTITIGSSKTEEQLSLWLGDDNVPLAGEWSHKTTAGFLFIRGTTEGRTSYTFAHTPDRLIIARMESTESGSGMGQKFDVTSLQTLTLH
ncbi:MAG TPA: hypothetical protein VGR02_08490 [Thermoanaerobaculia bacterium]|jgi:hypothetical protein|nr:hypothetical protein [Thermoanaerobaculia bacterium]